MAIERRKEKGGGGFGTAKCLIALALLAAVLLLLSVLALRSVNSVSAATRNGSAELSIFAPHSSHDDTVVRAAITPTQAVKAEEVANPTTTSEPKKKLRQISSRAEFDRIKKPMYFRLYLQELDSWLSRALDTNVVRSEDHEKIFKLKVGKVKVDPESGLPQPPKGATAFSIQGHTRLHLTNELTNRITLDRGWARGFEMWDFQFRDDGTAALFSWRNQRFVSVFSDKQSLMADKKSIDSAASWAFYVEESCDSDVACWGEAQTSSNTSSADSDNFWKMKDGKARPIHTMSFPLFGSPKPLPAAETSSHDPYDPVIIARRTLDNWGSVDGMQPIILTTDNNTEAIIQDSNTFHHRGITVEHEFEVHKQFDQPTYRGLFAKTFEMFPEAEAIMYSNSDILYTRALPETIRSVMRYVSRERKRIEDAGVDYKIKGFMIVGQRINHEVPVDWQLRNSKSSLPPMQKKAKSGKSKKNKTPEPRLVSNDSRLWWERDIEEQFSSDGQLFQSNAEDYFIVSRGLFDWERIPDFVVGGVAFDNWIVAKAVRLAQQGLAIVVDASKTVIALHQNHGVDVKSSHKHPKSEYNSRLAAENGGVSGGKTADATFATDRLATGQISVYDKHRMLFR
jgi:hypothetical protein